ncbi:response regulator transcription factor [Myroides odoratimimus]|uniref:response regulator transcription factor n=1 Tax=Myroides odoratimimus TaxID=76832 RepID=UPI0025770179|nr:response regulator transcription factor [Myroides odoratimimus]MDM1057925.1 response regulator transcription factor [Myroides odoratimimus]MDM1097794.1 response regulator transcription factor [Myroides odoratimimus]MDM1400327.1 response regulator transcription factor [Myroides odoratimimus]MDM1409847.1 response regulator transcription factor [Myroides odoratimimus]MDM1414114.1 response regulator transcription factor [Myroides odoratimimus]
MLQDNLSSSTVDKILVIEDDIRVAELLQRSLEEQNFEVDVAYDGYLGKKLALQKPYALIITDVILPKINGIDLCKEIKATLPHIPIIMLTALGTTDDKVEGFDAGADDYLVKPFELRELYVRIRALLKRFEHIQSTDAHLLKYADLELDLNEKVFKRNGQEIHLTPKEFNLLQYMMENPERVLSRTEISEKVWDTHFDTGTNFIDVYINYLRKKIEIDPSNKVIHTKSGMGFILKSNEN